MDLVGALDVADLAAAFARLPLFPLFDLGYFVVSLLYLRYEKGAVDLSRSSPFASWVCAMFYCFGSYILADLLLGEAPIDYFSNNTSILLATAVWYLTFYCPLNLFYKCVSFLPIKLVFVAMKEVVRVRKIAAGVHHAHHQYHHGWLIMIIIGFVKGSGVALMSNFEQLLRGVWKPETNELLHMTFPSKASLYGAILFTLQQTHWLPISKSTLIFFFTLFMMICKVASGLMVAVGAYARLSREAGAVKTLLAEPSSLLLAVGGLTFGVTFVGCLGALRDLPILLKAFAWILLIIFVLQVVAAVLGFLFIGMVREKAAFLMGQAITRYRDSLDLQNLIDFIQKKFECCGVHSYLDWSQNAYFHCQEGNPSLESCAVPFSCCLPGKEALLNTMCGYGTQNLPAWQAESRVHTEGCLEKIGSWARANLFLVAGLACGLLVLELVVFALALTLVYQVDFIIQKRQRRRRRKRSCPEK